MWQPSAFEIVALLLIALLLFGKRLPELARSMGKGITEFKKGLQGVDDSVKTGRYEPPTKGSS